MGWRGEQVGDAESKAETMDETLEAELGVYVQAATTLPPVRYFDDYVHSAEAPVRPWPSVSDRGSHALGTALSLRHGRP